MKGASTGVSANPVQELHVRFCHHYLRRKVAAFTLDVDLRLPSLGVTAIFGASGSGKTTLLRCLAGLERPTRGFIRFNGDTWQDDGHFLPTHKRPLGYVFQESSLFPHLTGQGNLNYALKRRRTTPSAEDYRQVVELMGIAGVLDRYPGQLSGGERQRVAIARALLIQPQLLLMDEPLASLDFARKQEILPYLEKLRTRYQIPIIYISHAMDEVARLADYLVVLEQGRVVAAGAIDELSARPDLPVTTSDLGVIWRGEVVERHEHWHLSKVACTEGALWVRDAGDDLGQQVRVRIKAGDVSLALNCHEDSSILNRLAVQVSEIVADRDEAMVLVRLSSGGGQLLARITRRSMHFLKLKVGMRLWAQIKSAAIVR